MQTTLDRMPSMVWLPHDSIVAMSRPERGSGALRSKPHDPACRKANSRIAEALLKRVWKTP